MYVSLQRSRVGAKNGREGPVVKCWSQNNSRNSGYGELAPGITWRAGRQAETGFSKGDKSLGDWPLERRAAMGKGDLILPRAAVERHPDHRTAIIARAVWQVGCQQANAKSVGHH